MDTIIAFAVKWSGLGALWDKIDGFKTKIAAGGLMLAGAGLMLTGVSLVIAALVACADHACQVGLIRGLSSSDNVAMVLKGFIVFKGGLLGLGIGHKIEKAADAAPAVDAPAAAAAEGEKK